MRLESPFNRQGAGLGKTRLMTDLLQDHVAEIHMSPFLMRVLTTGNAAHRDDFYGTNMLALLFYILLLLFGLFFDLSSVWRVGGAVGAFNKRLRDAFHSDIADTPWRVYSSASFYIQLVIAVVCLVGYAGFWQVKRRTCFGKFFQFVFTYLCKCLGFPFLLLTVSTFVSHVLLLAMSSSDRKWSFLFAPCLAVFSLPMLVIGVVMALSDARISKLPFSATDTSAASKWLSLAYVWVFCESMLQVFDSQVKELKALVVLIMLALALWMAWLCFRRPFFLSPLSMCLSSAVSLVYCASSLLTFIQIFVLNNWVEVVEWILVVISFFFGLIFQIVRQRLVNKQIEDEDFDLRELKTRQEVMNAFTFCFEKNHAKMSSTEILQALEEKYPDDGNLLIVEMRYLVEVDISVALLELSVYLMKWSLNNLYYSLQLCTIIERSIELFGGNNAMTLTQRQLDQMMDKCVDEHVEFWRCVLLNHQDGIAESIIRLSKKTENARKLFRQLNVEKERERSNFWVKYVDFLMNITVELTLLKHVQVDSSKPVRYDQRFAMNRPRRDAKREVEELGTPFQPFREIDEVRRPVAPGKSAFPSMAGQRGVAQPQVTDVISRDRVELCEAAEKVHLHNSSARFAILASTGSIMTFVGFIIFLFVCVLFGMFMYDSAPVGEWYDGLFQLYNTTLTIVVGISGDLYDIPGAIMDKEQLRGIVDSTFLSLRSMDAFMKRMNRNELDDVEASFYALIDFMDSVTHQTLALAPQVLDAASVLTTITRTALLQTEDISNKIHFGAQQIHDWFPKLQIAAVVCFAVLVPLELYGLISSSSNLKWLFWQPLAIDKTEIADVFQVFLRLSTTERRKSRVDPEVYKDTKERRNKSRKFRFKLKYIGTFAAFMIQYLIIAFMMLIVDSEVERMSRYSLGLCNCSCVFAHYQSSIFRLFPTSANVTAGVQYTYWYYYTLTCFRQTVYRVLSGWADFEYGDLDQNLDTSGVADPVNLTLTSFDDQPLYPIPDANANDGFMSTVRTAGSILFEVMISLNAFKGVYPTTNLPATRVNVQIENGIQMADFMLGYYDIFSDSMTARKVGVIATFIVFICLETFLLVYRLIQLVGDNKLISLFVRLILLLPDRTPFVEPLSTEIKLLEKMPESVTSKIMESFPVGLVILDRSNKCMKANKLARQYFGDDIIGKRAKDLSSEKYLQKTRIPLSRFPRHPFDKIEDPAYHSVDVHIDVTVLESNRRLYRSIQSEIRKLKKLRIPPSLASSTTAQTIMIFDSYSVVEVCFSVGSVSEELFMTMKGHLSALIDPIPTVFLCEIARASIFIVFTSFNSPTHQRQFLRDAMRCAVMIDDLFVDHGIVDKAKVAVTQGNDCLVKSIDDEFARFSFCAVQLPKSFTLMKSIGFGETVVEWSILKSLGSNDTSPDDIHNARACGIDMDYCVFRSDDPQWKTFYHVHR